MRYEKIAISLPLRAAETARTAVRRGKAPSVSAYVAAAIDEKAKRESWRDLMDEMLAATGGPMTAAERRWADRVLELARVPGATVYARRVKVPKARTRRKAR